MKTWLFAILCVGLVLILAALAAPAAAQNSTSTPPANAAKAAVPKYNHAAEAVFKGTVEEEKDFVCPVSGGMGSHIVLKLSDGKTIEVHLATAKWVKMYDLVLSKGDEVEVTGVKVSFEGVDTIFAREVKRGNDVFVFRDKDGNPVW
jgi:DNA/RNA endonuclease YhcR with UshA esterase domain